MNEAPLRLPQAQFPYYATDAANARECVTHAMNAEKYATKIGLIFSVKKK